MRAKPGQDRPDGRRAGVGARLALAIALGLVPVFGFFVYWIETERRHAHDEAERWTREAAEDVAADHARFLDQVKQTLELLTVSGSIVAGQPAACEKALRDVRARRPWMQDTWVLGPSGRVLCATDAGAPVPELDAEHARRLAQSGFALSELRADPDDDAHHVVAAMAVGIDGGLRPTVVETRIDVEWLAESVGARDGALVMALDHTGRVMAHSHASELVGRPMHDHPAVERLLERLGVPLVGALHDNVERIMSAARVPEWGATIIVGLGRDSVLATSRRDLSAGIAVLLLILTTTGGTAWLSARRLILEPVRAVRDTALSMAGGNFGRRVAPHRGPREIRDMARAFNTMADRLEGLALNDQLTGIPNRRHLEAFLARLAAGCRPFAILAIDLDGFKPINDRFGHAAGDETLRTIAGRMSQCVAPDGFCARVGGDEFVAVLPGSDGGALGLSAIALGESLRAAISAPLAIGEAAVVVSSSIGIALHAPGDDTVEGLMHKADRALYAAKAAGRNRLLVFDGTQPDLADETRRLRATPSAA